MRTTISIDDELLGDAKEFSGLQSTSDVVNQALRWFVAREAGKRLAAMGGTMPDLEYPPRRRPPNFMSSESTYPELDDHQSAPAKRQRP